MTKILGVHTGICLIEKHFLRLNRQVVLALALMGVAVGTSP